MKFQKNSPLSVLQEPFFRRKGGKVGDPDHCFGAVGGNPRKSCGNSDSGEEKGETGERKRIIRSEDPMKSRFRREEEQNFEMKGEDRQKEEKIQGGLIQIA